jgi:hypothetical protein
MEAPPPPPPPHGAHTQGGPRSGGLPDGKYDIFVVPPHSSGAGFLYLPSLQTQRNSFLAGVFCTAAAFFIYYTAVPVVKEWLFSTVNSGGTGVFSLVCGVAVAAWAFGKTQSEWEKPSSSGNSSNGGSGHGSSGHSYSNTGSYSHTGPPPQPSPPPPPHGHQAPPPNPGPQSSWQRSPPQANTSANTNNAKSSWEKAREETRKREEERKRAEELKKRREELEKERQRQKDELEKERLKSREKELRERLEREQKEKRDREERERAEKEAAAKKAAEKAEAEAAAAAAAAATRERLEKEKQDRAKRPPMPSAATERDDDAYSFRPYDRPKRTHKANSAASMYSESSYAPSVSTAKTTPPPSMRGPYATKDPDKIVIKGVFSFNNAFMRTPISQLVSGQGNVTDGLILRITTEGLFIDDDVRGVPQREWDVKAWTMKLAEVWCPNIPSPGHKVKSSPPKRKVSLGFGSSAVSRRETSSPSQSDSSAFVLKLCKACGECKAASQNKSRSSTTSNAATRSFPSQSSDTDSTFTQSCELSGLHVLRASIRDQEGKKYVFILSQSEGWKVAVGLQKLRRGSQVRALGVAGMPTNEAKAILDNLGYG